MEPGRGRWPKVSLHSLPPFLSNCPLPAIGYLKGYLEQHRPAISVTAAYWHQALWKLARPWVDDRITRGGSESYDELWDAVFARLYLTQNGRNQSGRHTPCAVNDERHTECAGYFQGSASDASSAEAQDLIQAEEPASARAVEFLEKYGSIFLDSQALESFVALSDAAASFLGAEAQRLRLDTMDIIGASVMHRQLIPALAFLQYAKRQFRPLTPDLCPATGEGNPLTVLGGFPTAQDARQIMTAFPFVDVAVFGDGEETLLEICDNWQDPAALQGLAGTVVRQGDQIIENPVRGYMHAPNMAFANYDGFDWSQGSEGSLYLPICNSRGCSWGKCAFCILNNRPTKEHSTRTPESVLSEIRQHMTVIRKTSQAPIQVFFLGNEIIGRSQGPAVLAELLRGLIELSTEFGKLSIFGELSPLDMTEEVACLLNKLEATLQLGFEQWSRVVELARKRHRIIHGVQTLKLFERYPNLHLNGFNLIIGFPGETLLDVYETKSNLWRLKYVLAPLAKRQDTGFQWGGPLYVNLRPLRMMQVAIQPEIVRHFDFQNPFIRENAAHRPWTVLLGMMCGDKTLAADYVSRNQYFEAYDTTATAGLQRRLVERLQVVLDECSIAAYRNPDGLLELLLVNGRHRLAVPLEECLLRILHETRDIVSRAELAERLAHIDEDEVDEGIEFLDTAELLYVSGGDRRLINSLPAHIQAEVDRAALQLKKLEIRNPKQLQITAAPMTETLKRNSHRFKGEVV